MRIAIIIIGLLIFLAGYGQKDTIVNKPVYQQSPVVFYKKEYKNRNIVNFYTYKKGDSLLPYVVGDCLYDGNVRLCIDVIWSRDYLDYWIIQCDLARHSELRKNIENSFTKIKKK